MQATSGLPQQQRKKKAGNTAAAGTSPYLHPSYASSTPATSVPRSPSPTGSASSSNLRLNPAFSSSAPYLAHGDYLHHGQPTLNPPANYGRMRPSGYLDVPGTGVPVQEPMAGQRVQKTKKKKVRGGSASGGQGVDADIVAAVMGVGLSRGASDSGGRPVLVRSTSSTSATGMNSEGAVPSTSATPAAATIAPAGPPTASPPTTNRPRRNRGRARNRPTASPAADVSASQTSIFVSPSTSESAAQSVPDSPESPPRSTVFDSIDYATAIYDIQNPPPHFTVPSAPAPPSSSHRSGSNEALGGAPAALPSGWGITADGRWSPPPHYAFVSLPSPPSTSPQVARPPDPAGDEETGSDDLSLEATQDWAKEDGWDQAVPLGQRIEAWRRRRRREYAIVEESDIEEINTGESERADSRSPARAQSPSIQEVAQEPSSSTAAPIVHQSEQEPELDPHEQAARVDAPVHEAALAAPDQSTEVDVQQVTDLTAAGVVNVSGRTAATDRHWIPITLKVDTHFTNEPDEIPTPVAGTSAYRADEPSTTTPTRSASVPSRKTTGELSEDEFDRIRDAERAAATTTATEAVRKAAEARNRIAARRTNSLGGSGVGGTPSGFEPRPDSVLNRPRPSIFPRSTSSSSVTAELSPRATSAAVEGSPPAPALPPRPARGPPPLPTRPSAAVAGRPTSAPLFDRIPSEQQSLLRPALVSPTVIPVSPTPSSPSRQPSGVGSLQRRAALHGRSESTGSNVASLLGRFEAPNPRWTPPNRRPAPPPPAPTDPPPPLQPLHSTIPTAPARLTPKEERPTSPSEPRGLMPGGWDPVHEPGPNPTPAKLYAAARRALRSTHHAADFSTLPASPAEVNSMLRRGSSVRRRPPPIPPRRPVSMLAPAPPGLSGSELSEEEADEARREQIAFRRRTLPLPPPPISPRPMGPRPMLSAIQIPEIVAEDEGEDSAAQTPPAFPAGMMNRTNSGVSSVFMHRNDSSSSEGSIRGPEILPSPPPVEPAEIVAEDEPVNEPVADSEAVVAPIIEEVGQDDDTPIVVDGDRLQRRRTYTYTDLDLLLSRLERAQNGSDYDDLNVIAEILGSARTEATAQGVMDELPVGRVEVLSRRVDKQGKVKQKLEVVGVRCNRCTVCMQQFRPEQLAVVLPCLHVYHTHCITSWLLRQHVCPVCREPVESAMVGPQ